MSRPKEYDITQGAVEPSLMISNLISQGFFQPATHEAYVIVSLARKK